MINLFYNLKNLPGCKVNKKMKSKKQLGLVISSALVLIAVLVLMDNVLSKTENPALSRTVFYVS